MKRGFTLVELSIVLVIIGILVGGIMVAQSMISAARVTSTITQFQQLEAGIVNFKQTYRSYPGDSKLFIPRGTDDGVLGQGDSDGDGLSDPAMCSGVYINTENYNFWSQMYLAKMIDTAYPLYSSDACGGTYTDADYSTGKLTPYTTMDAQANEQYVYGYASAKAPIHPFKQNASHNLRFEFYALPKDVLALETKLGRQSANWTHKQVGLANYFGAGNCNDTSASPVVCSASSAYYGQLYYYIDSSL